MAGTGASAAFQTLVTQAGISLANNQGNIAKTLNDLASSNSVRSLVTAAGTAGLTYGLCEALGVSQAGTSVGGQLQKSAVQTGVSTGFSIITQDQSLGEALLQGVINVGANTAGGLGAKYIGDIYVAGNIDALTHKALHALLGAIVGAASNRNDPGKGAAGGAIGAVGAELVAENLPTSMEPQTRADAGLAVGTALSVAAGQDGNAAILAGTNAMQNNCFGVHYSPDPEAAQQEMREETQGAKIIGEALATPITGLVEFQEGQVKRAVTEVHQLTEALRKTNLTFLERQNLRTQLTNNLEYIGRMQIFFPTTVGDALLLGGSVLPAVGPGVKIGKDAVKASKTIAKGALKLAPKITPAVAKAPGSHALSNALDLAGKPPLKKVAAPKTSVKPLTTEVPAADSTAKAPIKKRVTFKSSVEPPAKPSTTADGAPKSILRTAPAQKPRASYGESYSHPSSTSSRSPQAPSTAPPTSSSSMVHQEIPGVKATHATPSSSLIRQNYHSGRGFQESVHASTRIPENKTAYSILLRGKGEVSTIPDFPLPRTGVTEIKDVRYITFTRQLQAQAALARREGKSFNLVISPNTKRISKQVWNEIGESGGKIFEFNPATETWFERIVEGNIVLR